MSFQRAVAGAAGERGRKAPDERIDRAAYQVLALFAPFLSGDDRALIERLGADYL